MKIHITLRTKCGCERDLVLDATYPPELFYIAIRGGRRVFRLSNHYGPSDHLDAFALYLEERTEDDAPPRHDRL